MGLDQNRDNAPFTGFLVQSSAILRAGRSCTNFLLFIFV